MTRFASGLVVVVSVAGCAYDYDAFQVSSTSVGSGGTAGTPTGSGAVGGAPPGGAGGAPAGGDGGAGAIAACDPDQFAVAFDPSGGPSCDPVVTATLDAVGASCALYLGWRDQCEDCTDDPAKWGVVSPNGCANGAGNDNTCIEAPLGGDPVRLFGVNLDGNVNTDDKVYAGLECAPIAPTSAPGPCAPGDYATGVDAGGVITCSALAPLVVSYVRDHCALYMGWRDTCPDCPDPPTKWGFAGSGACTLGDGADNTCTTPALNGVTVDLFGLDLDGDVNQDDRFFFGLHCSPGEAATSRASRACPPGQLVAGVHPDGTLACASPAPAIGLAVQSSCYLYAGLHTDCVGCAAPPTRWGRTSTDACEVGVDGACIGASLDGVDVSLVALVPEATVGANDALFLGLRCF